MRQVVSSAAEAELGTLFLNAQTLCPIHTALDKLSHPQLATPLQMDNNTASGIINDTVKQKRSKAVDMRFYWLRDRKCQGQFHIFWCPGAANWADYFSKHHPASHHQAVCPTYLHTPPSDTNYYACLGDHPGEGVLIPQALGPEPITAVVGLYDLPHRPGQSHQCHSCVSWSHNAIHVQHSLNCGIPWECHFSPSLQNPSCPIHLQSQSSNSS